MLLQSVAFSLKKPTVFRSSVTQARELVAHDSLPVDQLRELNDKLMLRQVRFAMTHTAFYKDFYRQAGIELGDATGPEIFTELPIVTKEHIRNHGAGFLSDEATAKNALRVATGGSTGEPLVMKRDARLNPRAYEWRLLNWWGLPPYVDTAIIYRFFRSKSGTLKQKALWWPSRRFQLDAFDMTPAAMTEFLNLYRKVRPGLLLGYVGGVLELARFAAREGMSLPGSPVIATTAAPISRAQRDEIEAAFGGTVYDHYRCGELNWIAGECAARDGLHVFEDLKRLEVLDVNQRPVPDGQSGRVTVTDFTNRVFPLVRYELGDITSVRTDPCECGMPYRRISSVQGRVSDALILPNGEVIAGEGLTGTFSKVTDAVKQFQIVQRPDYSIMVNVIPREKRDDPRIAEAVAAVQRVVKDAVPVSIAIVDSIPHTGGKTRFIVNETNSGEQNQ